MPKFKKSTCSRYSYHLSTIFWKLFACSRQTITTIWWTGKDLEIFKSCEMSQNDQTIKVFSNELKILQVDFSKILTKHSTLWILLILQKLGQNNDFSRSYDVKRGQKSLKITKNQTNWRQSKKEFSKKCCFFIIFFLNESNKIKI